MIVFVCVKEGDNTWQIRYTDTLLCQISCIEKNICETTKLIFILHTIDLLFAERISLYVCVCIANKYLIRSWMLCHSDCETEFIVWEIVYGMRKKGKRIERIICLDYTQGPLNGTTPQLYHARN